MMFIMGTSCPPFGSDESVKSVINYSISVDSVLSVDYLFSTEDTDGHGGMSASERGGYCLSSELKRNLDGGSLAVQRLNSFDYLSADVRQMLYGFSSVSNLFNICGLYWSASGRGCGQELP